jgi:hypothetical protein
MSKNGMIQSAGIHYVEKVKVTIDPEPLQSGTHTADVVIFTKHGTINISLFGVSGEPVKIVCDK